MKSIRIAVFLSTVSICLGSESKFRVETVADGVHVIIQRETLQYPVQGNVTIIVSDTDVVVVDGSRTPSWASAVIAEIRKITPKPVRFLVNTHWHGDHHHGNATYRRAFPGIEILGHRLTREDIQTEGKESLESQIRLLSNRARLRDRLQSASGAKPLRRDVRHRIRQLLSIPDDYADELRRTELTPPTLTFDEKIVLYRSGRRIEVFSHGPGNTRSDAIVYLPDDRIVISGDLLTGTIPFMSESRPRGWLARLREIEALDFEAIVPGHGSIQRDRRHLDLHIALLKSLIEQVDDCIDRGLTVEQAKEAVDLGWFRSAYSQGKVFLEDEFDYRVTHTAVASAYRERAALEAGPNPSPSLTAVLEKEAVRLRGILTRTDLGDSARKQFEALGGRLDGVEAELRCGRSLLALKRLAPIRLNAEAMLASEAHSEAVRSNLEDFERVWTRSGERLRAQEARFVQQDLSALSPVVRAVAETALNEARPYYHSARNFGRIGSIGAGLFYLERSLAGLDFALFCAGLEGSGRHEALPSLSGELAALEVEIGKAYAEPEAAIEKHSRFIQLNATVKKAREMSSTGAVSGGYFQYLEARLLLEEVRAEESGLERTELMELAKAWQSRLRAAGDDQGWLHWQEARSLLDAESPGKGDLRRASLILLKLLPHHFEFVGRIED